MNYTIIGKPNCPYCDLAKAQLDMSNYEYDYRDISKDEVAYDMLCDLGLRTVPQIFHCGKHIGDYEDLVKYLGGLE